MKIMKTILLFITLLLFISCKEIPAQMNEHLTVVSVYTQTENFKVRSMKLGTGYESYKYKVQLDAFNRYVYLYTNTPYKVGDTLK